MTYSNGSDPSYHPTLDAAVCALADVADVMAHVPDYDRARDRRRWTWMARPGDRTIDGYPLEGVGRVRVTLSVTRRRMRISWVEDGRKLFETHYLIPLRDERDIRCQAAMYITDQQDRSVRDLIKILLAQ